MSDEGCAFFLRLALKASPGGAEQSEDRTFIVDCPSLTAHRSTLNAKRSTSKPSTTLQNGRNWKVIWAKLVCKIGDFGLQIRRNCSPFVLEYMSSGAYTTYLFMIFKKWQVHLFAAYLPNIIHSQTP